jgi:hypothetical protein
MGESRLALASCPRDLLGARGYARCATDAGAVIATSAPLPLPDRHPYHATRQPTGPGKLSTSPPGPSPAIVVTVGAGLLHCQARHDSPRALLSKRSRMASKATLAPLLTDGS